MPRRAGKAATRRARQRPPRRPNIPAPAAPPASPPAADEAVAGEATPAAPTPAPRRVAPPQLFQPAGSSLSQRERAEYHYVERDLRNIGILTAILAVLLLLAWFAFQSLGLIG